MNEMKRNNHDELLDEELRKILGRRYEDASHLFTKEAQRRRRSSREILTLKVTAFMGSLIIFFAGTGRLGLISQGVSTFGISVCTMVIGYFLGVCVSHNKGWRE